MTRSKRRAEGEGIVNRPAPGIGGKRVEERALRDHAGGGARGAARLLQPLALALLVLGDKGKDVDASPDHRDSADPGWGAAVLAVQLRAEVQGDTECSEEGRI